MSETPLIDPVPVPSPDLARVPDPIVESAPLNSEQQMAQVQNALRTELAKVGVTAAHLEAWKGRYGRIAAFPIYEQLYVVRPLRRNEWRVFMKENEASQNSSSEDLEEKIAAVATLFPQLDITMLRTEEHAGIATALARAVEMISGFTPGTVPIVL